MSKKPAKENADLLQLGGKQRAGRHLSEYIRAIGTEVDQVILPDTPQGCAPGLPRLVSKAEALARHIWRHALPWTDDEGMKHEPDIRYVGIVLERAEGRAAVMEQEKGDTRETVPDRVARMSVDRINSIASEAAGK